MDNEEFRIESINAENIDACVSLFVESSLNAIYHRSKIVVKKDLERGAVDDVFRLLVDENGQVFGYIRFTYSGMFGHLPFLDTIIVDEKMRGKGLGSLLEKIMCEELKSHFKNVVFLNVAECNVCAIDFYTSHEWQIVGKVPGMYKKEIDEIIMMKRIR